MKKLLFVLLAAMLVSACESSPGDTDKQEPGAWEISERLLELASESNIAEAHNVLESIGAQEINEVLIGVLGQWHIYHFPHKEDLELVKMLLKQGADPNTLDDTGQAAVFLARSSDMLEVFGEDSRTSLHVKTRDGATLLVQAIGARNDKKVEYLLGKGANPNEKAEIAGGDVVSPIHFAIQYDDDLNIVRLLLDHPDIDLNQKNEEHMTPAEWAKYLDKKVAAAWIREKETALRHS